MIDHNNCSFTMIREYILVSGAILALNCINCSFLDTLVTAMLDHNRLSTAVENATNTVCSLEECSVYHQQK